MCGIVGCALSNTTTNTNGTENGSNASASASSNGNGVTVADNVAPILLESLTTLQHRGQGLLSFLFLFYIVDVTIYVSVCMIINMYLLQILLIFQLNKNE